jgi:WhiB family redox-sensing transcriptional regulator
MEELDWRLRGACRHRDPELWFPAEHCAARIVPIAKQICHGCPVRAEFLEFALRTGEQYGIWGGLTVRKRGQLRRELNLHPRGKGSVVLFDKKAAQRAWNAARLIGVNLQHTSWAFETCGARKL